jgi:uncharacterized protein YcnI
MTHVLVDVNGYEHKPGMKVTSFKQEVYELVGFRVPHNDTSSGRVQVRKPGSETVQEFYPSVFELKIVPQSPKFGV